MAIWRIIQTDVCMYVRKFVRVYMHTYVCLYVRMYVVVYMFTIVRMYVHVYVQKANFRIYIYIHYLLNINTK